MRRLRRKLIISHRQGTAISDDRERNYAALGERDCTHVFLEAMVLPMFHQRPRYPEFPRASRLARQVPTACHEDFGDDGVSQGCPCLKLMSLLLDCEGFEDSVVLGLVCKLVLPGVTSLFICFLERVTGWNPKRFPPTFPFCHQDDRSRGRTRRDKEKRLKCRMRAYTVAKPSHIRQKVHRNRSWHWRVETLESAK